MATQNTIEQQLLDTLATKNFDVERRSATGDPTNDVEDAKTFTFDYVSGNGKNYGTMVIVMDVDNDMKCMYGDNLGRTMEGDDKNEFFDFLEHLGLLARRNRWTRTIQDISQLKHTMQGLAAIKEGLFEGYYGNRVVSYSGQPTEARLMIKHSQKLGEADARYRFVENIFIETADGERFKLESKSLSAARAMLEHVRQGGKPYDIRGCHITEMVKEIGVLSRFNRASSRRVMEGSTQQIAEQAQIYYKQLRENIKHLASPRGYKAYFEAWHPATITEQDELVEDIKNLFIEQHIDSRIEEALPLLARLQQQGQDMKEIQMFESWISNLGEGTWALPDTPETQQKLNDLMGKELIVGPDAVNATEQLFDVVGDDELFDILSDLAERSNGRANVWDDTDVQKRLKQLGVQLNTTSSAEQQPAPTPPAGAATPPATTPPSPAPQQPVAEDSTSLASYRINDAFAFQTACNMDGAECQSDDDEMTKGIITIAGTFASQDLKNYVKQLVQKGVAKPIGGAASRDITGRGRAVGAPSIPSVAEEINSMRKAAGLPEAKGVFEDSTGNTLDHICNRFKNEIKRFRNGEDLDDDLYYALFDYYSDNGEMPYGVAKARDADPHQWVAQQLSQKLGIGEGDNMATFEASGCNMTMEGEYCPEHGLAECGYMESMGGTVAGNVGEGLLDMFRKKPRDPANFKEYMVYDTFTIFYDPTDETFIVKGTGEYENKLPTKEFAANSAMGGLSTAQAYGEYRTGGIKEPIKVNRGVINQGAHEGVEPSKMGEQQDDSMNYNAAITGSYYEDTQDPLARIKSLALRK